MTQVWDATHIASGISGGGTTVVTLTSGGGGDPCAFASEGFTTGKYYYEFSSSNNVSAPNGFFWGIGNTNSVTNQYVGDNLSTLGFSGNNSFLDVWQNGVNLYGGISLTQADGDIYGIALDLTNGFIWIKDVTQGSGWVGAGVAGDPAATSNGISLTMAGSTVTAFPVVPGLTFGFGGTGETATGYFAQSSWLGAAPSGFGPFDAAATVLWWGNMAEGTLDPRRVPFRAVGGSPN